MIIPIGHDQFDRPRLLIIEAESEELAHLLSALGRGCYNVSDSMSNGSSQTQPTSCECSEGENTDVCCTIIDSLALLHEIDLDPIEVVICSSSLRDATGFEALAYLRGTRPDLPVIMIGSDPSLAVESIRSGAFEFLVADNPTDYECLPLTVEKSVIHRRIQIENERLHRELKTSLAELAITNHQLQSAVSQLEMMARTDELTSLHNRRWFNLMLDGHWKDATRSDLPLGCLMIDLDSFKSLNDQMGHQCGDEILKQVAKVIRANCREVDIAARYGGDEFCILMAHTEPHDAAVVASRILEEFDLMMRRRPEEEPRVGLSIGLSHINLSRPINADQLLTHADEAMYAAKSSGKQRVMVREADGVLVPVSRWTGNVPKSQTS